MPGDPGTRTVELWDAKGHKVGKAVIAAGTEPDVLTSGGRAFVHSWRGGYMEKETAGVRIHA